MLNHDASDDPLAVDPRDFYDDIEPLDVTSNEYRETSRRMISFMVRMPNFVREGATANEMLIRIWCITSALQHPATGGRSDAKIAEDIGCSRANFSKCLLQFERATCLPPKAAQKTIQARNSYRKAREAQLS